MELAFCFNNIARCEQMTGGSKEAQLLADKVSQAWINFARTGNPNAKGLPKWEPYTQAKGATMILDNVSQLKYHHDRELMEEMGLKF
jgi:para-nitrobenzyl esterase